MNRAEAGASRGLLCSGCAAEFEVPTDHDITQIDVRCPKCGSRIQAGERERGRSARRAQIDRCGAAAFGAVGRAEAGVAELDAPRDRAALLGRHAGGRGWRCSPAAGSCPVMRCLAAQRDRRLVGGRGHAGRPVVPGGDPRPRQRPRPGAGPGRRPAAIRHDRVGRASAGRQAARPGPPDLPAMLRRGGVGRIAGPDHRPAAVPGPHPGRAAGDRRPRAGAPGPGRRHPRRPIGAIRRGDGAGPRARGHAAPRAARRLGPLLPARVLAADRAGGAFAGGARRPALGRHRRRRPPRPRRWSRSPSSSPSSASSSRPTTRTTPTRSISTPSSAPSGIACRAETHTAMRLSVLTRRHDHADPAHPPCPTASPRCRPIPTPRPQRRLAAGHHVPRRPRDLRADAPQPALRACRPSSPASSTGRGR